MSIFLTKVSVHEPVRMKPEALFTNMPVLSGLCHPIKFSYIVNLIVETRKKFLLKRRSRSMNYFGGHKCHEILGIQVDKHIKSYKPLLPVGCTGITRVRLRPQK